LADNKISYRQHAVIEFLVKDEVSAADIHHRLQRLYGDVCMCVSSDRRWVEHFKVGNKSFEFQPLSGRLRTASPETGKKRRDEIIKEDRCVKLDAIAAKFEIRHNAIYEIIGRLGYRKICVRWVPCLLTEDHKVQ
jgi:hypothetical protein